MRPQIEFEEDEKKLWMGYPHLVDYLPLWLLSLLILFFLPSLYCIISNNLECFSKITLGYVIIICCWIVFFLIGGIILLRSGVKYLLTNRRIIIFKSGIKTEEIIIRIEKIDEVLIEQNFIQYIFRVGTIKCKTSDIEFPEGSLFCSVDHYKEILRWIQQIRDILVRRMLREEEFEKRRQERIEEERRKKQQEALTQRQKCNTRTPKLSVRKRPRLEE